MKYKDSIIVQSKLLKLGLEMINVSKFMDTDLGRSIRNYIKIRPMTDEKDNLYHDTNNFIQIMDFMDHTVEFLNCFIVISVNVFLFIKTMHSGFSI